jgi:Spy/CpxP family protein refolding chaperone
MENKPDWLAEYERAYPAGTVARNVTRPPKPDSYTMFTRLIEVVQKEHDLIESQRQQIEELRDRVKLLEGQK